MYRVLANISVLTFCVSQHQNQTPIQGFIQSISKLDEDGEVYLINTVSQDFSIDLRHSIDRGASAAPETSMKPFLDNSHVDKKHKFRVQFQGSHVVRTTKRGKPLPTQRGQPNPVYKFDNKKGTCPYCFCYILRSPLLDYLGFQCLLLGKEVKLCSDFELIKTTKETQCRFGTVSILVEPIYGARSILYFRSKTKEIQSPAFVEWPSKCSLVAALNLRSPSNTLTLHSQSLQGAQRARSKM
jgi:hypothetical protein